ncbi:hypothetical protein F5Y14DRAFT_408715 [Nemania sp. NC0429]|nr:hypothetical protein F5Y14DRAFT_408715 [Nemania sp. NC0429]
MADVNDPGDDGIPDQVREERDVREERLHQSLFNYIAHWHHVYNVIIHRGENVAPLEVPPYTDDFLTTKTRPVPFPLNLSETWTCGALIALILLSHDGFARGRFFEDPSSPALWAARVLSRVLLTVGAAVLSTLSLEVIGNMLIKALSDNTEFFRDGLSMILIKHFRWGQLDENGEPRRDENGEFMWIRDETHRQEFARKAILGTAIFALYYCTDLFVKAMTRLYHWLVERVLCPALYFFFSIPVDFVPKALSWLSLPTPAMDKVQDPRTLWLEYGIPVVIQFWVLALLWLLKILYMAKAERLVMQGWQLTDPKMNLVWHLIRATAFHLLAYTAYQLVCGIIVGMKSALPPNTWYTNIIDGPIPVRFLQRLIPEGRIFAAALLFLSHWLLRAASVLAVRLARPFWMPYILWQTRYSKSGARTYWPSFIQHLKDDFSVVDLRKRVISRVAMTALFGLGSSWPAMFHLSNVIHDE